MVRLPRQNDRLLRVADGKRFRVAEVARVEGGEMRFALTAEDGERLAVTTEELFPALHLPQPFRAEL